VPLVAPRRTPHNLKMTRRRWIADQWDTATATLTGDQALHLARVLRAEPGMRFDVVAGERVWQAEISSASDEAVRFTLLSELDRETALPLTLLLAVFKFDRLEWAIEKATELGVARVVPVIARRTEKHLAQAALARSARWRRIAQEAAKQSRRSDIPSIDDPLALKDAVRLMPDALRLLLSEQEKRLILRPALESAAEREIVCAVGPEGGWTEEEVQLFNGQGWTAVSLGPRILRAETAAISAAAIVSAYLA
jgi:16S rRNA (uracil1498-N3)-methyltransferase